MPDPSADLEPTVIVLYGATGDLARRMVLPALFQLAQDGLLPEDYRIVGNGRGDVSHENFQDRVRRSLEEFGPQPEGEAWDVFCSRLRFAGGGFSTDSPGSLLDVLREAERELGTSPRLIHYLAIPPTTFEETTKGIGEHGLADNARIVYEKPFGTDMGSFEELNDVAHSVFDEDAIYRIDHFLGKEATQDLHVLRFANGLFGGVWDARHIDSVQIDVPEELDVADRATFYDATGAVLDMLVTHLFQLAAEVAMEPPARLDPASIAVAREAVIGCFSPLTPGDVVLGQFDGYRDIDKIADDSTTDTFVAARLSIDNDRWRGVPFLLRTGKRMAASRECVSIIFRTPEHALEGIPPHGNVLTFDLKGTGSLHLTLVGKQPGPSFELAEGSVELPLAGTFSASGLAPYVRLISDVLRGDRSLFTRADGLAAVWRTAGPLLEHRPQPQPYAPRSWGPEQAQHLAGDTGWLLPV